MELAPVLAEPKAFQPESSTNPFREYGEEFVRKQAEQFERLARSRESNTGRFQGGSFLDYYTIDPHNTLSEGAWQFNGDVKVEEPDEEMSMAMARTSGRAETDGSLEFTLLAEGCYPRMERDEASETHAYVDADVDYEEIKRWDNYQQNRFPLLQDPVVNPLFESAVSLTGSGFHHYESCPVSGARQTENAILLESRPPVAVERHTENRNLRIKSHPVAVTRRAGNGTLRIKSSAVAMTRKADNDTCRLKSPPVDVPRQTHEDNRGFENCSIAEERQVNNDNRRIEIRHVAVTRQTDNDTRSLKSPPAAVARQTERNDILRRQAFLGSMQMREKSEPCNDGYEMDDKDEENEEATGHQIDEIRVKTAERKSVKSLFVSKPMSAM